MSRPTSQRSLTLTEELEKLEQQITLTLQEIDSNFSKAHRIVTTSILPIVEEYAKHSNEVWEGSKFWKGFFEASANVSLSGYEEAADETVTNTEVTESFPSPTEQDESGVSEAEEFGIESPTQMTGVQTTPRLHTSTLKKSDGTRPDGTEANPPFSPTPRKDRGRTISTTPSGPAQSTRGHWTGTTPERTHQRSAYSPTPRKYTGRNPSGGETTRRPPSTPRIAPAEEMASSPFEPEFTSQQPSGLGRAQATNNDPLMHRSILDKNYRIQATPMTQRKQKQALLGPYPPATATKKSLWDESPPSSPDLAAPELRSELFSPVKPGLRTPGVSILTPARGKSGPSRATTSAGRALFSPEDKTFGASQDRRRTGGLYFDRNDEEQDDDDDDDDTFPDMSPPKTIQFHVPQSRLLQTPAREASKKIVEDLLLTAGADATDEIEGHEEDFGLEELSPSLIGRRFSADDDPF